MSLGSLTNEELGDVSRQYCALGADIIRSGCALLHTTATVAYRAVVILHRFCSSVDGQYEPRGERRAEAAAKLADAAAAGVVVPRRFNTLQELLSVGIASDIVHIAAAAVLIATKMEQSSVRLRSIVLVFERIDRRRKEELMLVNPVLQISAVEYEVFKNAVLDKESQILFSISFNTCVEYPQKFVHVFLNIIAAAPQHPAVVEWLAKALAVCNDVARCVDLSLRHAAPTIACVAIDVAKPASIAATLPAGWHEGFCGVGPHFGEALALCREKVIGATTRPFTTLRDFHRKLTTITLANVAAIGAAAQPSGGAGAPIAFVFEEFKPRSKRDKSDKTDKTEKKSKKDKSDKSEKKSKKDKHDKHEKKSKEEKRKRDETAGTEANPNPAAAAPAASPVADGGGAQVCNGVDTQPPQAASESDSDSGDETDGGLPQQRARLEQDGSTS